MTDEQSTDNRPLEGRHSDGRFAPGNQLGTPWGPGNPPPKSPGRPKKNAWVSQLEVMLEEDGRLPEALAARLMKIALKGRDGDALRALELIENRIGGPVKQIVEADIRDETRKIVIMSGPLEPPPLPDSVRKLEDLRAQVEEAAQVRAQTEGA